MRDFGRYLLENVVAMRDGWLGEARPTRQATSRPAMWLLDHVPELLEHLVGCPDVDEIDEEGQRPTLDELLAGSERQMARLIDDLVEPADRPEP